MKPLRLFTISLLLLFTGYFVKSQNIGIQKNNPDFLEYLSSEEIQTGYVPLPFEMPQHLLEQRGAEKVSLHNSTLAM